MRSRLAITLMLVFGFALSGAGGALAISGGGETAGEVQYGTTPTTTTPTTTPTTTTTTPGVVTTPTTPETTVPETTTSPTLGEGGVKGETETGGGEQPVEDTGSAPSGGGVAPAEEVQEVQQVSVQNDNGSLPFTGFAAIPVLLVGLVLVGAGLVLRRGLGRDAA